MDAEDLKKAFTKFIKKVKRKYPRLKVLKCYADSAEQVLINSLKSAAIKNKLNLIIENALKGRINNRIRFYNKLLSLEKYHILKHCQHTIDAFENALWAENDKQEDERLDDGTTNIDTLDAQEYSTEKYQKTIQKVIDYGR